MSKIYRHRDGTYRDYRENVSDIAVAETSLTLTDDAVFFDSVGTHKILREKDNKIDNLVGVKNDQGKKDAIGDINKPRLSLIPQKALWALGGALTYGEKHYGTHNWRSGIKVSYLLDAALRHINEFNAGENIDQKSQNHHLGNAMANLAMAIELSETNPELDDRYKK